MGAYEDGIGPKINPSDWTGWVWPVPLFSVDGREPHISSEWGSPRGHGAHAGVDIMYRRNRGEEWPNDDATHSRNPKYIFIMPAGQLAIAAGPGKIWRAARGPGGLNIIIDHGNVGSAGGVTSYYQHLANFVAPWGKGDVIPAGTPLGEIGDNPSEARDPRHLHFELRFPVKARNPEPYMKHWSKVALGVMPP